MTEAALQAKVVKWCKANGYKAMKFVSPSNAGAPDLLIIGNGKVIFYELKNPNGSGRLTELQAAVHKQMREHGAEVYVGHDFDNIVTTIHVRLGGGTTPRH